ncbi:hypothetical protein A5844_001718 [Enterococcus sp. 10A9_DIV0425]|uniref:Uncharacterized protein n=1 Tax=Candidatus Enterococcus wittei TaxID=1987383 RepID=A0A242JYL9_9ENTE|nr:DUF624 domain-containing protein [Enterococcus sp. 10A9_DIV0425]OTP10021.1 hypothetical protein A5844_001718 [Enterococcus sp. 10A9_DIV0425]THE12073.1 DUF624 domain-containing protein [Enterococcus hirae]
MDNLTLKSIKLGERLLFIFKLQLFWLIATFRYFVVAGIFPATTVVIEKLHQVFQQSEGINDLTRQNFLKETKAYLKQANQVGYLALLIFIIFFLDLHISAQLIQDHYLHYPLLVLFAVVAVSFLYLFPCLARYELTVINSFKQAFFLVLSNITNTIAMILGIGLVLILLILLPFFIIMPIPLFLLPVAWFSYQAMIKLEKNQ